MKPCLYVLILCVRVLCSAARDAFKSFDKKSEDRIRVGDIEAAMKRLGHNIKPDWLEKIEHMIDADGLPAYYYTQFTPPDTTQLLHCGVVCPAKLEKSLCLKEIVNLLT